MNKICNKCGKEFEYNNKWYKNVCEECVKINHIKCSKSTNELYKEEKKEWGRKGAKKSWELYPNLGKKIAETNKRNGTGIYGFTKEQRSENAKLVSFETHLKTVETNRKNKTGFFDSKLQSELGKRAHQKHPDLASRAGKIGGKIGGKRTQELHPNLSRENGLKTAEKNKKNGNGLYNSKIQSMGGKKGGKRVHELYPNLSKENGLKTQRLYPNLARENGLKATEINRENSPYLWEGIGFLSKEEMKVAQIILNKPIVGINCHIKVNGSIVDFCPQEEDKMFQGKFVEYHPWDRKLTPEEYYNKRRKLLDENGFKDKELIVIDNQKFIKEIIGG